MRIVRAIALAAASSTALVLPAVLAAIPATSPTTAAPPSPLPTGWAAGLDNPVATPGGNVQPLCLNLWPGEAPNQAANARPEYDDGTARLYSVSIPGLLVYLPPKDQRAASGGPGVIACVGGSYDHLTRLVGADNTVPLLIPQGIAVVALKYRLKPVSPNVERDALADGKRAVRFVRAHAQEWGLDPHKVGMIGWSAGGNLILNLATHLDNDGAGDPNDPDPVERQSCRPDFVTLLSPWPNGKTISAYPPAKAEPGKSQGPPPAFIGSARDDTTAPFTFAQAIQTGWQDAGAKVEFYDIATGGHGAFELTTGTAQDWPDRWLPWMEKIGMWKKN